MSELDTTRHAELLKPSEFNTPIHVIGAGATGSWLTLALAKLGLTNITVWDYDVIEEHNIPNQAYDIDQVGMSKVDALQFLTEHASGTIINKKNQAVEAQRLAGVVFMMVDSMETRKKIWDNSIKMKSAVKLLVEPRMGLDVGRIYNVNPVNQAHIKAYEDTYYSDDEAEVSACGASMTVVTTAMSIASMCTRQLINWHNDVDLDNEILVDLKYNNFVNSRW
jgi:molybdopterin/thiamine biosynthesis adenylyltransferase